MRIAIEGCAHGKSFCELDKIYSSIKQVEDKEHYKVDLLIICGDFQSLRNHGDLEQMAVPDKFKTLGGFHDYYSGKKVAPILTIFVGGNHEGSNYLWELYHGGWVCPNIYFLGFAGVINVGGLRIGGMTGIFDAKHYRNGFFEVVPYNRDNCRSIYHVRAYTEFRLSQIAQPLDIFVSHDWPRGIYHFGNKGLLLRQKSFFEHEVNTNTLGSEVNERLLHLLKPEYWFAAHLHVKFAALVPHAVKPEHAAVEEVKNPDAIEIEESDEEEGGDKKAESDADKAVEEDVEAAKATTDAAPAEESAMTVDSAPVVEAASVVKQPRYTKFLALDKCTPRRDFLQILNLPPKSTSTTTAALSEKKDAVVETVESVAPATDATPEASTDTAATTAAESKVPTPRAPPLDMYYDEEWLAIVRATDKYLSFERTPQVVLPVYEDAQVEVKKELEWIQENVSSKENGLLIPTNFVMTAPPHKSTDGHRNWLELGQPLQNPQTVEFCKLIGLKNKINAAYEITTYVAPPPSATPAATPATTRPATTTTAPPTTTPAAAKPAAAAPPRGLSSLPPRPSMNLPAPKHADTAESEPVEDMGEVGLDTSGVDAHVAAAVDEMLETAAEEFEGELELLREEEEGEEGEEPVMKKRKSVE
ncbi:lariat debranching enzyme [Podochytrium sp. JEL0797]|nr:lariat debranching enzyme [Podochytrium sp. JEL0797]